MITKVLQAAAIIAVAGLYATADRAEAAFTWAACSSASVMPPDATGRLTANDGCNGDSSNNTSNPSTADFAGLFGLTGWVEIAKEDDSSGGANLNANGVAFSSGTGNLSGIWSVAQSVYDAYQYVAIVMKDGNQLPSPTIAYLVSTANGTWLTPWLKSGGPCSGATTYSSDCDNPSLSNVRFIGISEIPLPAALPMFLAGLAGLGFVGWRRRAG